MVPGLPKRNPGLELANAFSVKSHVNRGYEEIVFNIAFLCEMAFMLWLLVKGVKVPKWWEEKSTRVRHNTANRNIMTRM